MIDTASYPPNVGDTADYILKLCTRDGTRYANMGVKVTLPEGLSLVQGSIKAPVQYDPDTRTLEWKEGSWRPEACNELHFQAVLDTPKPGRMIGFDVEVTGNATAGGAKEKIHKHLGAMVRPWKAKGAANGSVSAALRQDLKSPTSTRNWLPQGSKFLVAPNPAKRDVVIGIRLEQSAKVSVFVSTIAGETPYSIDLGTLPAGESVVQALLPNLASGIYLLSAQFEGPYGPKILATQKVAVLR